MRSYCAVVEEAEEPANKDTWRNQDSLPILPLPEVKETCQRYRELLSPLLSVEDFAKAESEIAAFENTSLAEDLHNQLLELQSTENSWLEGFWDDMYLDIRDPLPINVNPFFSLKTAWKGKQENDTAARLVSAFAKFNKVLKMRVLEPDMEGKTPLCMYQYTKLFGYSRYPRIGRDVFSSNRYARHIIVMKGGEMFTLVIENEEQELLPVELIRQQLDTICSIANKAEDTFEVGYFTTANRDEWADNYQKLEQLSERNEKNLDLIGGALMVLNLDDIEFDTPEIISNALFHNRGANRWFDKLQMIVGTDGSAGFNMEHTPIDGHTLVRLATDIHSELSDGTPYHEVITTADESDPIPEPIHLVWDVDSDMRDRLAKAKDQFESFADSTESIPLLDCLGKRVMKKYNTSPDAFIQMAIQLAYYRENGKFVSTYESALTKQYLHGRTETIRTVSNESKEYCTKFSEEDLVASGALLVKACAKHSQTAKNAKNGMGVDRHLFGLNCLARKEKAMNDKFQVPSIFTSPYYAQYGSNIISTSNCGSDGVGLFGFGPVHPDGVGVGYLIQDDCTRLNISGLNGKASSFAKTLKQTMALQAEAARSLLASKTQSKE